MITVQFHIGEQELSRPHDPEAPQRYNVRFMKEMSWYERRTVHD